MALKDARQCEAKTKGTGKRCTNPAIIGRPTCRLHGSLGGRPPIHGLYSKELPVKLEEQRQELIENKEELLSLEPLIASLKIRLANFEGKVEASGAIWSQKEIELLANIADTTSKIIERYKKLEIATNAGVPREQVRIFINALVHILTKNLKDNEKLLTEIKLDIQEAAARTVPL